MSEDITSIYDKGIKNKKDKTLCYSKAMKTDDLRNNSRTYSYERQGVREKLLDIGQIESRLPTDILHAGLVRYICSSNPISGPYEAIRLIAAEIAGSYQEINIFLLMDENNFPLTIVQTGMGNAVNTDSGIEEAARVALLCGAKKAITIHNHSLLGSKDFSHFKPSKEDHRTYQYMYDILSLFDIELVDSVIISEILNEQGARTTAMYSLNEKVVKGFGETGETSVAYKNDYLRKKDTDNSVDFDDEGTRIRHKYPILTKDGVLYEDSNLYEETENGKDIW